jgi:Spy/CpxP family protein refolding chaperone
MTKELDLSTEQAIEFFPKLREFQQVEHRFQEEKTRILNEMRDHVSRGSTDKMILSLLDEYEQAHRDRLTGLIEKTKEMFEILTPRQRAKYLIFQDDFNREIREMIKKVKQHKGVEP